MKKNERDALIKQLTDGPSSGDLEPLDNAMEVILGEYDPDTTAESVAGEHIRAAYTLRFHWLAEEARFYESDANLRSAASYLMYRVPGMVKLFQKYDVANNAPIDDHDAYDAFIIEMGQKVVDYVIAHPTLLDRRSPEDYHDYELKEEQIGGAYEFVGHLGPINTRYFNIHHDNFTLRFSFVLKYLGLSQYANYPIGLHYDKSGIVTISRLTKAQYDKFADNWDEVEAAREEEHIEDIKKLGVDPYDFSKWTTRSNRNGTIILA